jgi:replication factor A1
MEKVFTKVKDLSPSTKQVNVKAKIVSVGEKRQIESRFGGARSLAEAVIGDETATVILSLWEDQINAVGENDTIVIDNGFTSLVRGHLRLNVGKYGSLAKSEEQIPEVNTKVDISAIEHEREPRYSSMGGGGGGGGYGGGGRSGGSGGGGYRGGGRGGYGDRGGDRDRGRRRF